MPGSPLDGLSGRDQPVRLTGEVRPPERVTFVKPEYPEIARRARAEGKVILEIVVGRTGSIEEVTVLRSNPLFDRAAVEAVRKWRYRPALQAGRPVKVYLTVVVSFELE
jgi:protein TonB